MMRALATQTHRYPRILAVSALLLVAMLLSACSSGTSSDGGMNHGGSGTATSNAPFDQQFIDMMVPHHMGAVEMAKIAQTRAEHPELKTLAANIIASQDKEIGQMKGWRTAWFGSDQTPSMDQMGMVPGMDMSHMQGMNMTQDIKNLQTASPFDKAFLQAMIPHHLSAIDAAKVAQKEATHPELKMLAGSIIADQQREIDQMQQWQKAWYGA